MTGSKTESENKHILELYGKGGAIRNKAEQTGEGEGRSACHGEEQLKGGFLLSKDS